MSSAGPLTNTILAGRYQLKDILGQGGMGTVYSAVHLELGRAMAVKLLHPHIVDNENSLLRFKSEMKVMSALSHPNLIAISDAGVTDEGSPFFVMEYLEGRSISDELQIGPLHPNRVIQISRQVADGLAHAHEKGIVHRDLKPANVMLIGRNDFVKIVDLGIAKMLMDESSGRQKLTQTGEVFGSPSYMSPEQCLSRGVDARTDIYSLGCMIFEMLTNAVPIQGASALETIMLHVNGKPFSLAQVEGLVMTPTMQAFEEIISRCLEKNPADRFQSMYQLMDVLNHVPPSLVTVTGAPSAVSGEFTPELRNSRQNLGINQPFGENSRSVTTGSSTVDGPPKAFPTSKQAHTGRSSAGVSDSPVPGRSAVENRKSPVPLIGILASLAVLVICISWYMLHQPGAPVATSIPVNQSPSDGPITSSRGNTDDQPASGQIAPIKHETVEAPPVITDESLKSEMRENLRHAYPVVQDLNVGTGEGAEHIDVVAAYFGAPTDWDGTRAPSAEQRQYVHVLVRDKRKPVVLFLYSGNPIEWKVDAEFGVKIDKIYLAAANDSNVVEFPKDVEIVRSSRTYKKETDGGFLVPPLGQYDDPRQNMEQWNKLLKTISELTNGGTPYRYSGSIVGQDFILN